MKKNFQFALLSSFTFCSLIFIFLSTFFSCGYHGGQGGTLTAYRTISVPYVEGDWDGSLTAALIKQMSVSGALTYQNSGASLILKAKILDYRDDQIGYRYERNKHGKLRKVVIPDETRTTLTVEVIVVEAASGSTIMGPVRLSADVEFDHDYYSLPHHVNIFSLGQLTDIDSAFDAAQRPLNECLAKKIVDYVTSNW
jgi:hypothetical protein